MQGKGPLQDIRILMVPLGSDVSQKRLIVWRNTLERLGGQVYTATISNTLSGRRPIAAQFSQKHSTKMAIPQIETLTNSVKKRRTCETKAGKLTAISWNDIDVAIVSGALTLDHLLKYFNLAAVPINVRCFTPDWVTFLVRERRHPREDELQRYQLLWSKCDLDTPSSCPSQSLEPSQSANRSAHDSQPRCVTSEVIENTEELQQHSTPKIEELQIRKAQLVNERRKIFLQNNPAFKFTSSRLDPKAVVNNKEKFVCQSSSLMQRNLNSHLTDPLEELMEYLHVERDTWREYSYKKVVSSLKNMSSRISRANDLEGLWWAKGRLLDRVAELLETGKIAKLEAKRQNARCQALRQFGRIWGVGPATAAKLYCSGFRNLTQLREKGSNVLSIQQRIGLRHYEDFLVKIPRLDEAARIEAIVVNEVHRLLPQAIAIACGSFRRGKSACGDCDIIITDPDNKECEIFPELIRRLHDIRFLTDDLTVVSEHHVGRCDSYMGVCHLNEVLPYRRIDIKVYPRQCYGCALLYFTGSDHFNRSMRLYARKQGWSLSDRELKPVSERARLQVGIAGTLRCYSEVDVFIALGLEYKDPLERNCFDIRFLEEDESGHKRVHNEQLNEASLGSGKIRVFN